MVVDALQCKQTETIATDLGFISVKAPTATNLASPFEYSGEVTGEDAELILGKITVPYQRTLMAAETAESAERANPLRMFAVTFGKAFYGFEPDFFQHNLVRIVDDAIGVIKSTLELRPTLVEICYFQKLRHGLPMKRISRQVR